MSKRRSSQRQCIANIENAKLSTGPRTPEGKAISSQNGVKPYTLERLLAAAVIPGECEAAFQVVVDGYVADFRPQTSTELRAVENMAIQDWQIARFEVAKNDLLSNVINADISADSASIKIARAVGSTNADREFINSNRAIAHCERQKARQLAFLTKSRKTRTEAHVQTSKAPTHPGPLDNRPTPEIKFRNPKPINEIFTENTATSTLISTPKAPPTSPPEP